MTRSETAQASRTVQAAPRARAYRLLAGAFRYPDEGLFSDLASGAWQRGLDAALAALPHDTSFEAVSVVPVPSTLEAAQVEYTRLFDVGTNGPPCPLTEGHHRGDRLRSMEEVMRFFDYFGLRFQPDSGLFPDHLSVELEFMEALADGETITDRQSALRAQHDFLERHLCGWLPGLEKSVLGHADLALYRALTGLASRFVEADRAGLAAQLRRSSSEVRS